MQLYPIETITTSNDDINSIIKLWQQHQQHLPVQQPYYGVYTNYVNNQLDKYEFSIATETPNNTGIQPYSIDSSIWYETFITSTEFIGKAWESIWHKSKQGLLKRAYSIDYEKYYPDGKVEIYISIIPHC
ncbi:GyrI-like domain-containing protein [Lonepinella sp. BR2474]|uniref:GyrI-like domain-containing protein n=1 Tax=Lonepinella sp. BR2474 TaxID=3434548 RepID=UPI003F6DA8E6